MHPHLRLHMHGWIRKLISQFAEWQTSGILGNVNDVLLIWTHEKKELHKFIEDLNNQQPSMFHSNHTKRSIVYRQALRVSGICSMECDFRKHISEMKTWLLRLSYPKNLVESEMKRVKFWNVSNKKSQNRTLKMIHLVATYHPLLNSLVSFRRAKKFSSYSLERTVSLFKCNKSRCKVCLNVNDTDTFTSTVTKKTYKICQKLGCSGKCLI